MINIPNFNEINHVVAYLRRVPLRHCTQTDV